METASVLFDGGFRAALVPGTRHQTTRPPIRISWSPPRVAVPSALNIVTGCETNSSVTRKGPEQLGEHLGRPCGTRVLNTTLGAWALATSSKLGNDVRSCGGWLCRRHPKPVQFVGSLVFVSCGTFLCTPLRRPALTPRLARNMLDTINIDHGTVTPLSYGLGLNGRQICHPT